LRWTMTARPSGTTSAVVTVPNVISLARIVLIPLFVWLIVNPETTFVGLVLFSVVVATDWIDGYVARHTGQVSDVGKVLDPTADRLAIIAGLIALVVRGAFPLWAALLVLVRDAAILVVGAVLLALRRPHIEVRWVGKVATFTLLVTIAAISWGNLGYLLAPSALAIGWSGYAAAIVEYYVVAGLYIGDVRWSAAEPMRGHPAGVG
jgi:cardiolipin synthase